MPRRSAGPLALSPLLVVLLVVLLGASAVAAPLRVPQAPPPKAPPPPAAAQPLSLPYLVPELRLGGQFGYALGPPSRFELGGHLLVPVGSRVDVLARIDPPGA
jgi:hypothetical protein